MNKLKHILVMIFIVCLVANVYAKQGKDITKYIMLRTGIDEAYLGTEGDSPTWGPQSFHITQDGQVYILDFPKLRIMHFDNNGSFLGITIKEEGEGILTKDLYSMDDFAVVGDKIHVLFCQRNKDFETLYIKTYQKNGQLLSRATIKAREEWEKLRGNTNESIKLFHLLNNLYSPTVIGHTKNGRTYIKAIPEDYSNNAVVMMYNKDKNLIDSISINWKQAINVSTQIQIDDAGNLYYMDAIRDAEKLYEYEYKVIIYKIKFGGQ